MMNTTGHAYKITNYGSTHNVNGLGVVIDGCPPLMELDAKKDIQPQLSRRRPGQSKITTDRDEADIATINSGITMLDGSMVTDGTPINITIPNTAQKSKDYNSFLTTPRPGHGDFVYQAKYGVRDPRGVPHQGRLSDGAQPLSDREARTGRAGAADRG